MRSDTSCPWRSPSTLPARWLLRRSWVSSFSPCASGVPLALLAALWATITDLIPQVGGCLGGALLGLLALTQGVFVFVVVVGLYGLYLTSRTMSSARRSSDMRSTSRRRRRCWPQALGRRQASLAQVATPSRLQATAFADLQLRGGDMQPFVGQRRPQRGRGSRPLSRRMLATSDPVARHFCRPDATVRLVT